MKKIIAAAVMGLGVTSMAQAGTFLNGGFEDGNFNGWTQGSGCWASGSAYIGTSYSYACGPTGSAQVYDYTGSALPLPAANFLPGGANYNPAAVTGTTILSTAGLDPITSQSLNHGAQYGNYLARLNDSVNNYAVSVIKQSVSNYNGTSINFAWWAVLEASHQLNDSDNFALTITDDTTGEVKYNTAYSSESTAGVGIFQQFGSWYSSGWQDITLNVTQGHNYTITLLASDCPYGGHAGYVYLDGFGTVSGGGGDTGGNGVPEPASLALVGLGLAGVSALRRRKSA